MSTNEKLERRMENTVRIGIVGCGMVARYHAKAIAETPNAMLIGACSKSLSSTRTFCSEFSQVRAYNSYDEMLAEHDINTVAVCSPTGNHYEQAKRALEAHKHVVVEKPICITLRQADDLIRFADEESLSLCVISQTRFSDSATIIKQAIDNGELGRPISASLMMRYMRTQAYYDQADWRGTYAYDGGGVLMNQGIHGIDLLCYFMGKPQSVTGYAKTMLRSIEAEDTAVAAIEFENQSVAVIDATVCSQPPFPKRFILCGEKGTIILEDDAITLWNLPTPCPIEMKASAGGSSSADPKGITHIYHAREYRNIVRHLLNGEALLIDGHQGRIPLSVILGVYESSKTGRKVLL